MDLGTLVAEDGTVLPPDPAERLLRPLYAVPATTTVRLSLIRAADGSAVGRDGTSRSLNGPEDHRILRVARSWADVVIVGARTVRAEGYDGIRLGAQLQAARAADGLTLLPHLAIVTRTARDLPPGLDPTRTWIVTPEAATVSVSGALERRVIRAGHAAVDVRRMRELLVALGYRRLLCEGGPDLSRQLLGAGMVTDYCLTTSPRPPGTGPTVPPVPESLRLRHRLTGNGFVMERYGLPDAETAAP